MDNGVRRGLLLWAGAVVIGIAWGITGFVHSSAVATVVGTVCSIAALVLLVAGGVSITRAIRVDGD